MDVESVYKQLITKLKKYAQDSGFTKAVIGTSGGVDSSVVLKLAVDALRPEQVTALIMPEKGLTKTENIQHAKGLCEFLHVNHYYQPINAFLVDYASLPWRQNEVAYTNTKARIRANLLYNYGNTHHALVLGTSNKSEIMLGYGTKYGDLAVDVQVIGDLFKTEVYELAEHMGLPKEIIEKEPSAELFEGQTDEQELGGSYKELDAILTQIDQGEASLIDKGMNALLVRSVCRRFEQNKHKSKPPYIIPLKKE